MNARNTNFQQAMEQATGKKFDLEFGDEEGQISRYDGQKMGLRPNTENPPTRQTHAVVSGTLHGVYWAHDATRLYGAEEEVKRNNRIFSKKIPLMEAKGIASEIIFHPIMDTIPHIDTLRKIWNPSEQIHNTFPADRWGGKHADYYLRGATNYDRGDIYLNPSKNEYSGMNAMTITHETAHLLASPWVYGVHSNVLGGNVRMHPQHNWIMAKVHTMAVEAALGTKAAQKLKKEYREAGVDFGEGGTEVNPWDHIPKMEQ
jgi:hypothetical protein